MKVILLNLQLKNLFSQKISNEYTDKITEKLIGLDTEEDFRKVLLE
jgi:hypothetical protein